MNIVKTMSVKFEDENVAYVTCGIHRMYMLYSPVDGMLIAAYTMGGCNFKRQWPCSGEGIEEALWEWLCTLSRFTNPFKKRVLGSLRAVRAA